MRDYDDPKYKKMRSLVLRRDKYKCQMPDCISKAKLHVHHILPWSSFPAYRYDVTNGIVLCRLCHQKTVGYEHCYAQLFTRIVHENTKRH